MLEGSQGIHPLERHPAQVFRVASATQCFLDGAKKVPGAVGDNHGEHLHLSLLPFCLFNQEPRVLDWLIHRRAHLGVLGQDRTTQ